ncbi:MAG: YceI family protein [Candidatus Binatia bacterium]|nr:YceI family protein [Candidatus Binatia bacterium]
MRVMLGTLFGLLLCLPLAVQAGGPMVYAVDPSRSELVVQLFKAGIGAVLAHDHVVRATAYTGSIEGDPGDPTTAVIVLEVQVASLQADEPEIRQKYGLAASLSEADRRAVQATMLSARQLDVQRYPLIRFRSTRVTPQGTGKYVVTGELTIRGITQPVSFPVQVELRNGVLRGWGSLRFLQSSFGYAPYSAFLGAVQNQDEVLLHFDVTAVPAPRQENAAPHSFEGRG